MRRWRKLLLAAAFLTTPGWAAATQQDNAPVALVPPTPIGGATGMRIGADGKLYAGAVMSQGLFRVDLQSRAIERLAAGPAGGADDLVFLPDGTLLWTAFMEGKLMARDPQGHERVVAANLPGIDGIALRTSDNRLFVSQCFTADALWEIDPSGGRPPRKILDDLGCLNGFDFGADGKIYGPSWFGGKIVRIDPDRPTVETVIDGLHTPAAAKFGPDGKLYVASAGDGRVLEVDVHTRTTRTIAQLGAGLDNLVPWGGDRLLVSSLTENSITSIDLRNGAVTPVIQGHLTAPGGLAACRINGVDQLFVADITTLKRVDTRTGAIAEIGRDHPSKGALIISPLVAATGPSLVMLSSFGGTVQWLDVATGKVKGRMDGLASPYGLAELPGGVIAVAEFGAGRIGRIDTTTAKSLPPIATGLDGPTGLLALSNGTLVVSEAKGGSVAMIDVATGAVRRIAQGLQSPEGLARMPDGRLLVAEAGARRLLILDPEGRDKPQVLAADLPIGLPPQSSMPLPFLPTGIAVSGSAVYFGSDVDRAIYKLPLAGKPKAGDALPPPCDVRR